MKCDKKYHPHRSKRSSQPLDWFPKWELVEWVVRNIIFANASISKLPYWGEFFTLYMRLQAYAASRPQLEVADRVKEMRLALHRRVLGMDRLLKPSFRTSRSGLPKFIPGLLRIEIYKGNREVIRGVLTLLSVTRAIKGGKPIDTTPLSNPSTGSRIELLEVYISGFLKQFHIKPLNWEWKKFHFTTKSGPNGPGLETALWDLYHMTENQIQDLEILGGYDLGDKARWWDPWFKSELGLKIMKIFSKPPKVGKTAKLSVKKDSEGKSRIFAILDYWSQTALKGLHHNLFKLLRRIPMDKTFNQSYLLSSFKPDQGHSYHSIDLTSATDRFPITIQRELLSFIIGEDKADAWVRLLTDRDYYLEDKPIRYGCGQPMGAYSSWAAFALSHHLLVYIAARKADISDFKSYVLLGDDIVIGNDDVAREYKRLLEHIGVEYSKHKTFTSQTGFEFAKRLFINGIEYSPISLPGLMETSNSWPLFGEFLNQVEERDYSLEIIHRNPDQLRDLFMCLGVKYRLARNLANKTWTLMHLPRGPQDFEFVGSFFRRVSQWFGASWSCNYSDKSIGLYASKEMYEVVASVSHSISLENQKGVYNYLRELKKEFIYNPEIAQRGTVDHNVLLQSDWFNLIPVMGVLSFAYGEVTNDVSQSVNEFLANQLDPDHDFSTIWEYCERPLIMKLPPISGVVPDRASQRIARARGELISRLFAYLRNREKGLSIGRG